MGRFLPITSRYAQLIENTKALLNNGGVATCLDAKPLELHRFKLVESIIAYSLSCVEEFIADGAR